MSFSLRKGAFLVCDALERAGFLHAFGTRKCAASDPDLLQSAMEATGWSLKLAKQTHSDIRLLIEENPLLEGDAFVTRLQKTLAGVKTADCVPILIGDPKSGAMAAVHAGWRGTLQRIAQKTVSDLKKLGVSPSDCVAAIGPSACGDCYEVGPEVAEAFQNEFPQWSSFMKTNVATGKAMLDVPSSNREQLIESGIPAANLHLSTHCTMHQNDLFFSHRREGGPGRQLSVIGRVC